MHVFRCHRSDKDGTHVCKHGWEVCPSFIIEMSQRRFLSSSMYMFDFPPQTTLFMISRMRTSDLNPEISNGPMIVRPGPRAKEKEIPAATKHPKHATDTKNHHLPNQLQSPLLTPQLPQRTAPTPSEVDAVYGMPFVAVVKMDGQLVAGASQ